MSVRCPKRREEAAHAPLQFVPRREGLIAHAVVQSEFVHRLPAVLHVSSLELAARIEELARSLDELVEIAEKETGDRVAADIGVERELARLLIQVVHIDFGDFAMISGIDVVPAQQEVNIVGQRVVATAEEGLRIIADREVTAGLNLVDLLIRRLPDIHAQIARADTARNRAALVVFELIADNEVIDDVVAERMRFRNQ